MSGLKQTIYRHILKRIRNRQFNVKLQEVTLLFEVPGSGKIKSL